MIATLIGFLAVLSIAAWLIKKSRSAPQGAGPQGGVARLLLTKWKMILGAFAILAIALAITLNWSPVSDWIWGSSPPNPPTIATVDNNTPEATPSATVVTPTKEAPPVLHDPVVKDEPTKVAPVEATTTMTNPVELLQSNIWFVIVMAMLILIIGFVLTSIKTTPAGAPAGAARVRILPFGVVMTLAGAIAALVLIVGIMTPYMTPTALKDVFVGAKENWGTLLTIGVVVIMGITVLYGSVLNLVGGENFAKKAAWVAMAIATLLVVALYFFGQQGLADIDEAVRNTAQDQLKSILPQQAKWLKNVGLGFLLPQHAAAWKINWSKVMWVLVTFALFVFAAMNFKKWKIIQIPALSAAIIYLVLVGSQMIWDITPDTYKKGADGVINTVVTTAAAVPDMVMPTRDAKVKLNLYPAGDIRQVEMTYDQVLIIYRIQEIGKAYCTVVTVPKSWLRAHGLPTDLPDEMLLTETNDGDYTENVTINEPYRTMMKEGGFTMTVAVFAIPGNTCPNPYPRPE